MSNIRTLVNQYFPSNTCYYASGIVKLADHRPYEEKKKEFAGILCKHVNNGDGVIFTPNLEDEYIVIYGTPIMSMHRWIIRELELFADNKQETVKNEIEKRWKTKISDIPQFFDLIPWIKVKMYEDYSTYRYECNESYNILEMMPDLRNKKLIYSRKDRITLPQFCEIMSGIIPEEDCDIYFQTFQEMEYDDSNYWEDNPDYEVDPDYEDEEGNTTLITNAALVSFMMEIEQEGKSCCNLELDDSLKMSVGYVKLLKSIIKKYKKNIGHVIELPDIGLTLWQLPKK